MLKKGKYIRTVEHRNKMSEIKKKQIITDEWKKNISINHADVTGNNNPNWKNGISSIKCKCLLCDKEFYTKLCRIKKGRGKFCSRKCLGKWMSIYFRGDRHPMNTGKQNLQKEIRACSFYRNWRNKIYQRDNYTCILCGCNKGGFLNADHIIPLGIIIRKYNIIRFSDAIKCKKIWDLDNGRTLCLDCHKKTKTYLNASMVVGI